MNLPDILNQARIKTKESLIEKAKKLYIKKKRRRKRKPISLALRYKVFKRDKFKCRCGRSPATDPTVILHVDHKIPVSKNGTNDIDNLETMCNYCNIGKGDKIS
jgi:5-methylcytosine-specific restriction endonuclease McrA